MMRCFGDGFLQHARQIAEAEQASYASRAREVSPDTRARRTMLRKIVRDLRRLLHESRTEAAGEGGGPEHQGESLAQKLTLLRLNAATDLASTFAEYLARTTALDEEAFDGELDGLDLALELAGLVGGDGGGDDGAGDAAGPAEGGLGGDKDVGDVLVLAEEGQVEDDLDGLDVGGHHDELADAAVERLGGLVGTLLELLVVRSLLDEVEDLVGERGVGQREGLGVGSRHCCGSVRDGKWWDGVVVAKARPHTGVRRDHGSKKDEKWMWK
ncbi:hypothetical protein L1887_49691 [Cichorium endivia]|nr:hypothetical protein L1887_49691 [Cichorium endivia]